MLQAGSCHNGCEKELWSSYFQSCCCRLVELKGMADRITSMRVVLKGSLEKLGTPSNFFVIWWSQWDRDNLSHFINFFFPRHHPRLVPHHYPNWHVLFHWAQARSGGHLGGFYIVIGHHHSPFLTFIFVAGCIWLFRRWTKLGRSLVCT